MSEVAQTAKYKVLYNRLTGSTPFAASTAIARITALADALEITQDEAAELTTLAQERGTTGATVEERLAAVDALRLFTFVPFTGDLLVHMLLTFGGAGLVVGIVGSWTSIRKFMDV